MPYKDGKTFRTENRFGREAVSDGRGGNNEKPWLNGKSGSELLRQHHSADFSLFSLYARHYKHKAEYLYSGSGGDFSHGLDL